ncbi:MAG: peptide-methionine (S)-S-oxide reductase MsrA [Candidatus Aenigmatarchaeota archaeon]|nr:MAG: peptide-methionine (S)-S-oxide reductase MsrA [Candidatus Aenigmarchaeota archaeon]
MGSRVISKPETAFFGAGCFWHVQADFDMLEGVVETTVGYMGGSSKNPTYDDYAHAGHIEVCKVVFNPKLVAYKRLLQAFWNMHDPTQGNRQGLDLGAQYRSVIFYATAEQKKQAEASLTEEQAKLKRKITTAIERAVAFWPAEDYHQKYNAKHGIRGKVC